MSSVEVEGAVPKPRAAGAPGLSGHLAAGFAFILLAISDGVLRLLGFRKLHRLVAAWPTLGRRSDVSRARALSDATDRAATLYFKHPWCLQRSATAVMLLRCLGYPAELVIGVRRVPFYTHAWVEMGDEIINETPQSIAEYHVLERV